MNVLFFTFYLHFMSCLSNNCIYGGIAKSKNTTESLFPNSM